MYLNTLSMFVVWLSNGNLQCRFEDKSELVVGRQHSMYLNANRITLIFASEGLAQQNKEIILKQRRLASLLKRILVSPGPSKENVVAN